MKKTLARIIATESAYAIVIVAATINFFDGSPTTMSLAAAYLICVRLLLGTLGIVVKNAAALALNKRHSAPNIVAERNAAAC